MQCRNCNQEIKFDNNIRSQSGKAIPLDPSGEKHDCPNNPYKKKAFNNFKQVAQQVDKEITQNPSSFKKTDALGRIAELEVQTHADIKDLRERLLKMEDAVRALVKEISFKKGTEFITEPKKYEEPVDEEVMED